MNSAGFMSMRAYACMCVHVCVCVCLCVIKDEESYGFETDLGCKVEKLDEKIEGYR